MLEIVAKDYFESEMMKPTPILCGRKMALKEKESGNRRQWKERESAADVS